MTATLTGHRGPLRWLFVFAIFACAFALPAAVRGQDTAALLDELVGAGIVDPRLAAEVRAGRPVEAIITLDDAAANADANASRVSGKSALREQRAASYARQKASLSGRAGSGMTVLADYRNLGTLYVRFDSPAALALAGAHERTSYISPLREVRPTMAESLDLINAVSATRNGYDGTGVTVAVLDTGLDHSRPHFGCTEQGLTLPGCRVALNLEVNGSGNVVTNTAPLDDAGLANHGTNVAGVVSAVAPGAKVIGIDVFNSGGSATDAAMLAAIDWVLDNAETYNIRAVNLSIGDNQHYTSTCSDSGLKSGFQNLRTNNIAAVVAAGNSAYKNGNSVGPFVDGIAYPGCTSNAFTVGATHDSYFGLWSGQGTCPASQPTTVDTVACFSQTAPILDILAPGVYATAAGIQHAGTSQAAPHVAAAFAILAAARPNDDLFELEDAIKEAGPLVADHRIANRERHRLDICAALLALGSACGLQDQPNDDIGDAIQITGVPGEATPPFFHRVSTADYTIEPADPPMPAECTISAPPVQSHSAWYRFTTVSAGLFTASTENSVYNPPGPPGTGSQNPDTNTIMALWDETLTTAVRCNDDYNAAAGQRWSRITNFGLQANTTYYLEVTSAGNNAGGYLVLTAKYTGELSDGSQLPFTEQLAVLNAIPDKPATVSLGNITVVANDNVGSLVSSDYSTQVTIGLDGPGTIACENGSPEPLTKTVQSGVVTWHNCVVDTPGTFTVVATANPPGISQASSNAFLVTDPGIDSTCDGAYAADDALATMLTLAGMEGGPTAPCTGDANHDTMLGLADVLISRRTAAGLP